MNFSETPRAADFYLDSPVPPKLDLVGARSHFYRTPQTPTAASSLSRSMATPNRNEGSRKRARYGYDEYDSGYGDTVGSFDDRASGWDDQPVLSLSGLASPAPFVDTRYRLAGGVEAPRAKSGLAAFANFEDLNNVGNGPEVDYRPSRYSTFQPTNTDTSVAHEGNSKKRNRRPSTSDSNNPFEKEKIENVAASRDSWGQSVINLVGKVWDFCWTGPFRGFYSGGGRGYDMNTGEPDSSQNRENLPITQRHGASCEKSMASASGQFTIDQQDGLRTDWVLIKNEFPSASNNSPSNSARKMPRRSSVAHVTPRRSAARPIVSKRPSISTSARPSSSYRHKYSASTGSNKPDSPAGLEAQRYAAKMRKKEREEDASISRLNQQLKAMIKEGKEALGTRIEVDDMGFDDSD